jgi:hypothetical protein
MREMLSPDRGAIPMLSMEDGTGPSSGAVETLTSVIGIPAMSQLETNCFANEHFRTLISVIA